MCGIAGIIRWDGAGNDAVPNKAVVQDMLGAMRSRGPDEVGVFHDARATLGCCRLAVVDLSTGSQPQRTPDGRYTIVYNGECYELRQLREQLLAVGMCFRTRSDTEVVLHAFARWGPACLDRLNGMFALAIWDHHQQQLFLARDRFGIKPLYYADLGDRFLFGSTLDALIACPWFSRDIDAAAVQLYLATRFIPAPRTIYRQARKLPAGHCAIVRDGHFQASEWWDWPLESPTSPTRPLSAVLAQVDDALRQATKACLVAERPMGLCLSGGIDSGLLASYLPAESAETFCLGFPADPCDETSAAQRTARHLNLPLTRVACDDHPDELLDGVVGAMDEPMADSSALALLSLCRAISRRVTVVLSGSGGDELFGGYRRHAAILLADRWGRIPGFWDLALGASALAAGRQRLAARRFTSCRASDPLSGFLRWIAPTTPELLARLRTPEYSRDAGADLLREVFEPHFARTAGLPLVHRLAYLETKTVLTDAYLVKEDRMAMACSLEGRFPLLDQRVAELAWRLPPGYKLRGLRTKWLLRRLASRRLPAATARGAKRGFEVPLADWLRGPWMPRLYDQLLVPTAAIGAYCRPDALRQLVAQHQAGVDHSRLLYGLLLLELWLSERVTSARLDMRNGSAMTSGTTCARPRR
ncbi:MAG: asparagine synthase (glutamine-hydrolyzing) [Pirellulaceae bacterium]|nr:asparagine synthase (glutamine-hydrolyzing) [Pirellulaceae bacterium]